VREQIPAQENGNEIRTDQEITDRRDRTARCALNAGRSEALTSYLKASGVSIATASQRAADRFAKPEASYVAGFRTWNQLGRFVKKVRKAS